MSYPRRRSLYRSRATPADKLRQDLHIGNTAGGKCDLNLPKYHIKRYLLPAAGNFVWGVTATRSSKRPFMLSASLPHLVHRIAANRMRRAIRFHSRPSNRV